MSMDAQELGTIPAQTVRVAHAACRHQDLGNGFRRQIGTKGKRLLPSSNLMPHDISLLSAQLHYRHSFW